MKIETSQISGGGPFWHAYDADNYDGAPDAKAPSNIVGRGTTERDAIENLVEQLTDHWYEEGLRDGTAGKAPQFFADKQAATGGE